MIMLSSNRVVSSLWRACTGPTTSSFHTIPVLEAKRRSGSSNEWLTRQRRDPYVRFAIQQRYRARSAFKLAQIDEEYKILKPGMRVLDCGAAPGSWSQVLAESVNATGQVAELPKGCVIAADIQTISPIEGVIILNACDLLSSDASVRIREALSQADGFPKQFDLICSDMSPNASGTPQLDHEKSSKLVESVLILCVKHELLKAGGALLSKFLNGGDTRDLMSKIGMFFDATKRVKPTASRDESTEEYVLARRFRP